MSDLAPFIIAGLVSGSLYGLAGVGLALTFRISGIFNFAHGAIAAAAAYLFYDLHVVRGWPWPLAALLAVGVFGPLAGLITERIAFLLRRAQIADIIVATVGLLLLIQGLLYVRYGAEVRTYPQFLPTGSVTLGGVKVSYDQLITFIVAVTASTALYGFLRLTRLGVAMRAVVDSPELMGLSGTNPAKVRMAGWVLGSTFAALSGVLVAPRFGLDAIQLTLLVVLAFGAVAIGAFSNLLLTFGGGLLIGVVGSVATRYLADRPPYNGVPSAVPFFVLILVLILLPPRWLPSALGRIGGAPVRRLAPKGLTAAGGLLFGAVLLAVPFVAGTRLPLYINALSFVMVFLSLSLLVRTSGQISLCQAAFVAVGATTFSHLTSSSGLPWLAALLLAGLVVVPVGALVALVAVRLSGLYLALVTFGFGLLMQNVVFNTFLMFGEDPYLSAPRPHLGSFNGSNDKTFYFMVLAVLVGIASIVVMVNRSRLGRFLRAMAQSPTSLATNGLEVTVTKALVFCLSAFIAGVAGALLVSQGQVTRDYGFGPFESLTWLVVVAVAGARPVSAAFVAAGLLVLTPGYLTSVSQEWQTAIFGGAALLVTLAFRNGADLAVLFRRFAVSSADRRTTRRTRASSPVLPRAGVHP